MRKLIRVTKKHIETGKRYNPRCCPVSLAVRDAQLEDPTVSQYILFRVQNRFKCCPIPKRVESFIINFDARKEVKPFNFYITL